ncbi:glycosyltransferase [Treponema sp.]|uniref:GumK N-terminal domain-containing glycosyltransferase n=1 Tax=Treponema sp. TaxID=166 RepID=UPI00257D0C4C|nr:glycosyltransferase [Treponema sp.]MBE6353836.1 glycosyltransferase family 1 protein [Treponema sp.]
MNIKKITFLTGHNWISNRLGGFHKFAQAACEAGIETVFFSFPRPYYGYFMKQELFNKKSIKQLQKGITYNIGAAQLHNVTLATLKLPNSVNKLLSDNMMNSFERFSFTSFRSFAKKWLDGTDVFVFESCDGMIYVDKIKQIYPNAKIVYRPSDPMMFDGALERYVKNEKNIMKKADLNIIVNQEGLDLYSRKIPDFETSIKYVLLSNGVDIESYEKTYECPDLLKKENTILYVGAWEVEWTLLFKAAEQNKAFNYIVVCPNYPSEDIQHKIKTYSNLFYIPGIRPSEVPAWITNCSVVMVPYVTDFYKNRPLGITAKYYQAMAAHKPIVAYCDTPKLKETGVVVTYTYDDFITGIQKAVQKKHVNYSFDLSERKWNNITNEFLKLISGL